MVEQHEWIVSTAKGYDRLNNMVEQELKMWRFLLIGIGLGIVLMVIVFGDTGSGPDETPYRKPDAIAQFGGVAAIALFPVYFLIRRRANRRLNQAWQSLSDAERAKYNF